MSSTKITKVEAFPVSLQIAPGKDAIKTLPCVIVKIHTDAGVVGVGDTGNISAWYSGATQDSILGIISEIYAPLALLGRDPTEIESILSHMDYLALGNTHARMAIDMALFDLKGKLMGVPVYQLLGGKSTDKIKIGWVNADRSAAAIGESARRSVEAGYQVLKVKVGQSGMSLGDEVARVKAVRDAVGDRITLNIDANGGWSLEQATAALKAMTPFNIGYVEQPLHPRNIDGMTKLRQISPIPVFGDEAIFSAQDIIELNNRKAIDGVFLKLCKTGGMLNGLKWIDTAKTLHLPVITGCMSGSAFECAAYLHFLAAHSHVADVAHDCGPPRVLGVYSTDEPTDMVDIGSPIPVYREGYGHVPTGPGLGVELNDELMLKQLTEGKAVRTITDRGQARHDGYRAKL